MNFVDHRQDTTAGEQAPHAEFLGLPFGLLPLQQVLRLVIERRGAAYGYLVTPNAYHVVAVHDDPARLLPIYRGAWLSVCDSRILRALAKLDGQDLPLVTGSDLAAMLLAALNRPDAPRRKLLVVGPDLAIETALRAVYPNLSIEVVPAPAGLGQNAAQRLAVARVCLERTWDIALLCVGCPAQELIAAQLGELGRKTGTALCVGAAIDFVTGARVRAPRWVQRLSLEWAYRLLQEPGRLWRRYLVESPKILRIYWATRSARGR
jgi:N-acetylglucosaminyldiphosphoundecaprenol N-acetyl-beta-D-mannosaminyltransferase